MADQHTTHLLGQATFCATKYGDLALTPVHTNDAFLASRNTRLPAVQATVDANTKLGTEAQ